jgi:Icc-related predicted phosphoesterase
MLDFARNMRILPLSDLHFEFHADEGKEFVRSLDPTGVDVLVLAGDVTKMRLGFDRTLGMFRKQFPICPIIFVPGNHEYHESDRETVSRGLQNAVSKVRGVYWLDCNAVVIDGQRFLGTTLWYGRSPAPKHPLLLSTDEEWGRGIIRHVSEKGVVREIHPDFEAISDLPGWVCDEHERSLKFLTDHVQRGDVVVTHFLPSQRSVAEPFRNALSNCWYVTDVHDLIEERRPALWIHGHTHTTTDYSIGDTRIVCNPLGYVMRGERNDFDPRRFVEPARAPETSPARA